MCSVAADDFLGRCFSDGCDADGQSRVAACGVTAHDVHMMLVACLSHTTVDLRDVFHLEASAYAQAHGYLFGRTSHGEDVAQVDHDGLVA